jgi:hypothetical protein
LFSTHKHPLYPVFNYYFLLKTTLHSSFVFLTALLVSMPLIAQDNHPVFQNVLFVGDSITHHGPAASLAWTGNWGMAASSESADYVHLFIKRLTDSQQTTPNVLIMAEGGGTVSGQLTQSSQMTDFHADLAVIQMGENDHDMTDTGFKQPYEQLITSIRLGNPNCKILCLGTWGPPSGDVEADALIRKACDDCNARFVDIHSVVEDPSAAAAAEHRFTNDGVNWHPSDKGMSGYASLLWAALNEKDEASVSPSSKPPSAQAVLEEKWDGNSSPQWIQIPAPKDAILAVCLHNETPQASAIITTAIPLDSIRGRWILVETKVKGEQIASRPHPWNGTKLVFGFTNAEGKSDYPQAPLPDGTFDWRDVRWQVHVPINITKATLSLGLESVEGTVWFGPIRISILP